MSWLKINSPRWTHEIQRWLFPGDAVEVPEVDAAAYAYHTEPLTVSTGHDVPMEAAVTLRTIRSLYAPDAEGFVPEGQEFDVSGERARQIPVAFTGLIKTDLPRPLPEMISANESIAPRPPKRRR